MPEGFPTAGVGQPILGAAAFQAAIQAFAKSEEPAKSRLRVAFPPHNLD